MKKTILILFCLVSFVYAQNIMFNGLTYKVITSPITNKQWLDRNLGAMKKCTSKTDIKCFGNYYQWGRRSNGHEKANSKTTLTKLFKDKKSHNHFIKVKSNNNFDWRENKDDTLWKSSMSKNNVCPQGFKVPSIEELNAEIQNNNSFLNIPLSGYKSFCNGKLVMKKQQGALWSSSPYENDSYYLDVRKNIIEPSTSSRADAFSVRCIKE